MLRAVARAAGLQPVLDEVIEAARHLCDGEYGSLHLHLAGSASPWLAGGEEVEDTEMVHAVAPGATISIVLVKQSAVSSPADFATALTAFLRLGPTHGGVLSLSASVGEHYLTSAEVAGVDAALRADRDHHVTVVAASGDKGAASDLHWGPPRSRRSACRPPTPWCWPSAAQA